MAWKTSEELSYEWQDIKKDWYNVYQWGSLQRKSYSDDIANIIIKNLIFLDQKLFDFKSKFIYEV